MVAPGKHIDRVPAFGLDSRRVTITSGPPPAARMVVVVDTRREQ